MRFSVMKDLAIHLITKFSTENMDHRISSDRRFDDKITRSPWIIKNKYKQIKFVGPLFFKPIKSNFQALFEENCQFSRQIEKSNTFQDISQIQALFKVCGNHMQWSNFGQTLPSRKTPHTSSSWVRYRCLSWVLPWILTMKYHECTVYNHDICHRSNPQGIICCEYFHAYSNRLFQSRCPSHWRDFNKISNLIKIYLFISSLTSIRSLRNFAHSKTAHSSLGMCKIFLWMDQSSFNCINDKFNWILNSIELSLVGWAPGLNNSTSMIIIISNLFPTEYKQWRTEYMSNIITTQKP